MSQAVRLSTSEHRASDRDGALQPERLYAEHARYLRALISRLLGPGRDPDDLVQEVFLRAWRKRSRIRPESTRAWLRATAVKLAQLERQKLWFRRVLGLCSAGPLPDARNPELNAQASEARRLVYEVLDELSEKRRAVFVLFELEGLTGPEIAEALGCPLKTVWTRLYHARSDFQQRLLARTAGDLGQQGGCRG